MSTDEYPTIEQLFEQVLNQPSREDRHAFVDEVCADDQTLRARLEALVRAHEAAGDFLKEPAVTSAETLQGDSVIAEGPGTEIDRYKLLQKIGEGGFGVVYMAEQREPVRRKVALKIIKLGMDTRQVIARFEAERQALAMMDHPNIAKVLDAGATETGRPYFVMELVKGEPITEYCDKHNLDVRERLALFQQVCHAVQHAHQKGIIHRDLKPSNVMITLHDGKPVPKVIDFGIAKATNARLTEKTVFTEYRQFIGTPEYMSPEQAEMSGLDIDTRSDVYSLGVLLYELLTGTTPFDGAILRSAGYGEIQRIIREETPVKPSTRLSTLDTLEDIAQQRHTEPKKLGTIIRGDLDWIVMKALEKDRQRRYETANGFAMDIERYLHDEPVVASPPSTSYKLKKLIKRNKGVFTAATMIFLVLTLGVIGTTWGLVSANAEAERAERELVRANEVKRLIKDMFSAVQPEEALAEDTTLLQQLLQRASTRLETGQVEDDSVAAELYELIGSVYRQLGLYERAERHLKRAVAITTRLYSERDAATLAAQHGLALLYARTGRKKEAEALLKRIIPLRQHALGDTHRDTLSSMAALAVVYSSTRRYEEAEEILQQVLSIQRRTLGHTHQDTLATINNLGIVYKNTRRREQAEQTFRQLVSLSSEHLGERHPRTAAAMHNLAVICSAQRRYPEAEDLYKSALSIQQEVYGDEHPITIETMTNLATMYMLQGRIADAEPLYESSFRAVQSKAPGDLHSTMNPKSDAAGLLRSLMSHEELINAQVKSAEEADAPPERLNEVAWHLLTCNDRALRDPTRALPFAHRACELERAGGGEKLWMYLDTLARAQHMTGDTAVAVETQRRAIELMPDGADPELQQRLAEYEAALTNDVETAGNGDEQ